MRNQSLVSIATLLATLTCVASVNAGPVVATGSAHVIVLTDAGTVWTWGWNGWGQLGDGSATDRHVPVEISISGVVAVAAGGTSTYAVKTDGTVWAWGANTYGQLGDGTTDYHLSPVQTSGLTNVIAVAAGPTHALALKADGSVWAWGDNRIGQVGDGTTTARLTPVQVSSLGTLVQSIAADDSHSSATKIDGTVWSWGRNAYNEAGDGTVITPRSTPVQTGALSTMIAVAAGFYSGFAWDASGAAKAWGYNGDGQLGDGTQTSRSSPVSLSGLSVVSLDSSLDHSVAATSSGSVMAWGANYVGQLGDGTTSPRVSPVAISGVDGVVAVSTGDTFSVVLSSDGRVWTWGYNGQGELGDGTTSQRLSPVQISDAHFAWRVATPVLSPTGGSYSANTSVTVTSVTPSATIHYSTNGVDPTDSDPTITSGGSVTLTQTTTLKAKAWVSGGSASSIASGTYTFTVATPSLSPGSGTYTTSQNVTMSSSTSGAVIRYTLDGSTPTAGSSLYSSAIAVTSGTTLHAAAFLTGWATSTVASATYTFNYGALAAPVFTPAPAQIGYGTQVAITAAATATIRYTINGTTPTSSSAIYTTPITVTGTVTLLAKAFNPDWTTSAQSGGVFTVKVGATILSPGAGTYAPGQAIAISNATPGVIIHYTTNGLDPTSTDPVMATGGTVVAGNYTLKAQGFQTGWTSGDIAAANYAISGAFTSWAVAGGNNHTVALRNDGTVWTWGYNGSGELGDSNVAGRSVAGMVNGVTGVIAVGAGAHHTVILRIDGTVWTAGDNSLGQLGDNTITAHSSFAPVSGLSTVTAIAVGSSFTTVVKGDGTVWAWGANDSGQLGDGTFVERHVPTQVSAFSGATAIAAGDSHTLVRKTDGTLWAWGANGFGQLGDGTSTTRVSPAQVPGITASAGPWAGSSHSFAATADGGLYAWGWDNSGQLGIGGGGAVTPTLVTGLTNVTVADGGGAFTIARSADGSVWVFGYNGSGQLDGTSTTRATPYEVPALTAVATVGAGLNHSLIVTTDGSVWAMGFNASGQLGDGTTVDRWMPTKISEPGFDWKASTPRFSPDAGTYTAVTNITITTVTLATEIHYTTNGTDPTTSDPIVASGGSITVDQGETLKAAAWHTTMPVSNVATAAYVMSLPGPTLTPASGTYVATQSVVLSSDVSGATIRYTTDGTVPIATSTVYSGALSVDASTTVIAKSFKSGWLDSATATRTYVLKVTPPAFSPAGGGFAAGQAVSISTTTPSAAIYYTLDGSEPTASSSTYAGPITASVTSTLKAIAVRAGWTTSDSSAASFWITLGTVATPTLAPPDGVYATTTYVTMASATSGSTIRYTTDGSDPSLRSPLYQWPIAMSATTVVKARAYKDSFTPSAVAATTYALDDSGAIDTPVIAPAGGFFAAGPTAIVTVQTSGATLHYTTTGVDPTEADAVVPSGGIVIDRSMVVKVGAWSGSATPSRVRRADFVITGAVSSGSTSLTTHALKADGTVWSWGDNTYGQLGIGVGGSLHWTPVVATGLAHVTAIASGATHALAITSNGAIWSWGNNLDGELGSPGNGWNIAAQIPGLQGVSGQPDMHFVSVAAGDTHSLALRDDGTVWTWGGNASGQLGDGTAIGHASPTMVTGLTGVTQIAAGHDFSLAVESDGMGGGRVWAWGGNASGQLGDGSRIARASPVEVLGLTNVVAIAGGYDFAIAAVTDGTVWAWGQNSSGQLGDGSVATRVQPVIVPPLAGAFAVFAGSTHAGALTNDGRVWAWGSDVNLALGDGSNLNHSFPLPVQTLTGDLANRRWLYA